MDGQNQNTHTRHSRARLGLVHIYTGNGKGKTTAAIGLTVRAAGHGFRSRIVQFMKGATDSGEVQALRATGLVDIDRIGLNFIGTAEPEEAVAASLVPAMKAAREAIRADYDLVVLDEIIAAVFAGAVSEDDVLELISDPGRRAELVLTGRGAGPRLIDAADLVTEMRDIKHPYADGRRARAGVEF